MAALQACLALGVVVALVLLAGLGARRYSAGALLPHDPQALRLRATVALDAKRRVHLLETQQGAVLVLTGGASDQILTLPACPPTPDKAS